MLQTAHNKRVSGFVSLSPNPRFTRTSNPRNTLSEIGGVWFMDKEREMGRIDLTSGGGILGKNDIVPFPA